MEIDWQLDYVWCNYCGEGFEYSTHRDKLVKPKHNAWACVACWNKKIAGHFWSLDMKKIGTIYFVLAEEVNRVKIGYADDAKKRLRELQIGSPVLLKLMAVFKGKTIEDEAFLHTVFDDYRVHGEWFEFSQEIRNYLNRTLSSSDEDAIRYEEGYIAPLDISE